MACRPNLGTDQTETTPTILYQGCLRGSSNIRSWHATLSKTRCALWLMKMVWSLVGTFQQTNSSSLWSLTQTESMPLTRLVVSSTVLLTTAQCVNGSQKMAAVSTCLNSRTPFQSPKCPIKISSCSLPVGIKWSALWTWKRISFRKPLLRVKRPSRRWSLLTLSY